MCLVALLAGSDDPFGLVMGRNSEILGSNPGRVGYSSLGLCMYNAQFEGLECAALSMALVLLRLFVNLTFAVSHIKRYGLPEYKDWCNSAVSSKPWLKGIQICKLVIGSINRKTSLLIEILVRLVMYVAMDKM